MRNGIKIICLALGLVLLAPPVFGQGHDSRSFGDWRQDPLARPLGAGVMLGEPTGVNAKYWLNEMSAIDLGLAWAFSGDDSFHLHADYLLHDRNLVTINGEPFIFYFGIGPRFKFETHDTLFGARIPVGLSYQFAEQPIDMSFELAPILDLAPDTDLALNVGLGARYYF